MSAENLVRPPVPVGQGHVVSTVGEAGADGRRHVAFLALGVMVAQAKGAARQLTERGLSGSPGRARHRDGAIEV